VLRAGDSGDLFDYFVIHVGMFFGFIRTSIFFESISVGMIFTFDGLNLSNSSSTVGCDFLAFFGHKLLKLLTRVSGKF